MEKTIHVNGMMCTHCKAKVEKVSKAIDGVENAVVDLQEKTVTVTGEYDVQAVKDAITKAGFDVVD